MQEIEARAWLSRVLAVCENEIQALDTLGDTRLTHVLQMMTQLRAEIVATLATLAPDASQPG
jgi:hypothetical protein